MMDERDLDRAIDAAAGTMMSREPSRALHHKVLARVREGTTPAPWRFVWVTVAASVVMCGAAIALMGRIPAPAIPPLPSARPLLVQPGLAAVMPIVATETARVRRTARGPVVARAMLPAPTDASPIEPIETSPIVLSVIDVPQLEREVTLIETISIEPLTIEPLAASND